MPDPKIRVPANLIPVIRDAADYYGIPFSVLAGTIQLGTSWTNNVDDQFVAEVATKLADDALSARSRSEGQSSTRYENTPDAGSWMNVAAQTFGGGAAAAFRSRLSGLVQEDATDLNDEERWTYDKENPAPTGSYVRPRFGVIGGDKVIIGTGGRPKEPFVIEDARRWADSVSMSLTGRILTTGEMASVVSSGWNPDKLESYMRAQKYGTTDATVGEAYDLRRSITQAFSKAGLPDPTESQINWAVVNRIPSAHADAYAEQTKSGTVWGSDPEKFTTARTALHQLMGQYGIVVPEKDIDTNLVNQAVSGKWSADQMRQSIASGQMPGAPIGTTVDHYSTTKNLADSVWKTYFPTTTMPQPYTNQFLSMTPDQITMFVRALPSEEAKAVGSVVPVGVYNDAKNVAKQALSSLGVVGRDPSAQEVAAFSTGKLDVEAIAKHYATDPSVLAVNPGAQYGKSREDYYTQRRDTEAAYNERFGGVSKDTLATDAAKAANPTPPGTATTEPDWLQHVFKEGMTPQQSSSMFDDYFRRLGRAPSATDIDTFKTRSTTTYSDFVQGRPRPTAAAGNSATPTLPGLEQDKSGAKRGFA